MSQASGVVARIGGALRDIAADRDALLATLRAAAPAQHAAVSGTVLHRQAAFVTGSGVLLLVAIGRLGPCAPLLPRWSTLGLARVAQMT